MHHTQLSDNNSEALLPVRITAQPSSPSQRLCPPESPSRVPDDTYPQPSTSYPRFIPQSPSQARRETMVEKAYDSNPYTVEQDGDAVTATIDWAKTITFDIPNTDKVFVGTITNQWQGVSYGNVVSGKLFAPQLAQYSAVNFQITNYPRSSMLIEIADVYATEGLMGVFKGAIGLDTNAGVETYNGVGKITTKM